MARYPQDSLQLFAAFFGQSKLDKELGIARLNLLKGLEAVSS